MFLFNGFILKKWVVGYRPDDFLVTLHNESTMDQDVATLRESHMNFMRGKKLSLLIDKLVSEITPEFYKRYDLELFISWYLSSLTV